MNDAERPEGLDFDAALKAGSETACYWMTATPTEVMRACSDALNAQHRAALDALRAEVRNQQIEAFSGMLKADKALYEKCLDTPGFAYWFNRAAVPPVVFVAAALPLPEVTR